MVTALIQSLINLGKDSRVVYLIADDKEIYDALVELYPNRTFNIGIAECNGISLAAGLENAGFIPYVIGGCSFMAFRALDFIRVQVCMQKSNVKVIGIGAGLAISVLGNTQHGTEDLAVLRALPNLKVVTPSTPTEVNHVVETSYQEQGPTFIRVGRSTGTDFYMNGIEYRTNKIQKVKDGGKLLVFSTGSIVCDVLQAVGQSGEDIGVVNVHTISPLDEKTLEELAKDCQNWLSVEEHNMNGGLGSALAEAIMDKRLNVSLSRMGLKNQFAKGYGSYEQIKRKNGLSVEDIYNKCMELLEEK